MAKFLLLCLVALATASITSAQIAQPQCKYVSKSRESLYDIDYYGSKRYEDQTSYVFYLQAGDMPEDDCTTPGCCDPNATFRYVSIVLAQECGPASANQGINATFDYRGLSEADIVLATTEYNATKITMKLPRTAPSKYTDYQLRITIPNTAACGAKKYAETKYGPCESDGCAAQLTVQNDQYVNCCTVNTYSDSDLVFPTPKLPANTGIDVSSYPISLLAVGDWGAPIGDQAKTKFVAAGMNVIAKKWPTKGILNVGDNFYENGLIWNKTLPPNQQMDITTWEDMFLVYPSLNVPWYSTLGNHDYTYGISRSQYGVQSCIAKTEADCRAQACCASSALQYEGTGLIKNKLWRLKNGTWTVPNVGGISGLADLFVFDTNPLISGYKSSSSYSASFSGMNSQNATAIKEKLYAEIAKSKATWKIVQGHHVLENYGSRCVGDPSKRGYVYQGPVVNECADVQDVKLKLWELGVPFYLNGHDHTVQFVKNASGPTHYLTIGNAYKQSTVLSQPPVIPTDLLYGKAPEVTRPGDITRTVRSDLGFASLHISPEFLVVKIWGMGVSQLGTAPDRKLHLAYELKISAPVPGRSPSPASAPAPVLASPSPTAVTPSPTAVPPSPTAVPPSPVAVSPSPTVASPSPSPVSPSPLTSPSSSPSPNIAPVVANAPSG